MQEKVSQFVGGLLCFSTQMAITVGAIYLTVTSPISVVVVLSLIAIWTFVVMVSGAVSFIGCVYKKWPRLTRKAAY